MIFVFAIFLIIISLLQPSLKRLLNRTISIQCSNNQRVIYSGIMFLTENQESNHLPLTGHYYGGGKWEPTMFLIHQLMNESLIDDKSSMFCPAEEKHHGLGDYGTNQNFMPFSWGKEANPFATAELNLIKSLSHKVLFIGSRSTRSNKEIYGSWMFNTGGWVSKDQSMTSAAPWPPRHGNQWMNGIFLDGHYEALSIENLIDDKKNLFEGE